MKNKHDQRNADHGKRNVTQNRKNESLAYVFYVRIPFQKFQCQRTTKLKRKKHDKHENPGSGQKNFEIIQISITKNKGIAKYDLNRNDNEEDPNIDPRIRRKFNFFLQVGHNPKIGLSFSKNQGNDDKIAFLGMN